MTHLSHDRRHATPRPGPRTPSADAEPPARTGRRATSCRIVLVPRLRPARCCSCSCPRFKPDLQIFGDLDLDQGVPAGRRHLAGQLHRRVRPGPVLAVPDELDHDLGASPWCSASSSTHGRVRPGPDAVPRPAASSSAIILATLIVPFETLALPLLWWVNKLPCPTGPTAVVQGWLDTYQVQIIPFIANAFSIYLFYQYFDSIPKELDEAAKVDGAGWFRIYRSIVMPLSGPAIATVAILTFLPAWNQYLWPLMVGADRGAAPGHGRHRLLQAAQHLLGADHGLRHDDHHPGPGAVHRLPAVVHPASPPPA